MWLGEGSPGWLQGRLEVNLQAKKSPGREDLG